MISPRRGEEINVLPYGRATVEKLLGEGKVQCAIDRIVKRPDGTFTSQIVAELHPVWIASSPSGN